MQQLPTLHLLLTEPGGGQHRRRTRRGIDVRHQSSPEDVIGYLREHEMTLTYDPAVSALRAEAPGATQTITLTAS